MTPPHPKMPTPTDEMTPQELADAIAEWARDLGYRFNLSSHASEFGKVLVKGAKPAKKVRQRS